MDDEEDSVEISLEGEEEIEREKRSATRGSAARRSPKAIARVGGAAAAAVAAADAGVPRARTARLRRPSSN